MSNYDSVLVKGNELRSHRKKRFSSAEAFSAACESVSVPTVYRAERGGPVLQIYLKRMAQELGMDVNCFTATPDTIDRIISEPVMTGDWGLFHVIADPLGNPTIQVKDIELEQNGTSIEGSGRHIYAGKELRETFANCLFKDNVLSGLMLSEDWPFPMHCPYFVLSTARDPKWFCGHIMWFDLVSQRPETSRCFFVKKDHSTYDVVQKTVWDLLNAEMKVWRMRKLQDVGYDFKTANQLLETLE